MRCFYENLNTEEYYCKLHSLTAVYFCVF